MAPSPRPSIDADRPHLPQIVVPEAQGIVDDDDLYGVSPVGVSDGFRPPHLAQEDDRIEPVPAPLTTSLSNTDHSPRPSSAQKPPPTEDFTLRHDGRMGYLSPDVPNAASEAPSLTRTLTTESDGPIIVPEGPYRGPTRPSHTYRMQSHDSRLQRTISNATTSTMAISRERAYDGPNGPTHPYALYPQNTVPEPEPEIVNANIPIGFNSTIGQQYQRRTGPEGEETADLIGPHGHTEQLPPYTRYPEVAYLRKTPPGSPAPDSARRLSIEPSAGGMGLATRNPEFSSHEELPVRQSAEHSRASIGAISSMTTVNSVSPTLPAAEISEKIPESEREDEKKWKRVARRKVCGIVPVWALCMAVTVVVVVAVLLGAILGVVYSQRNDDRKRPYNTFQ